MSSFVTLTAGAFVVLASRRLWLPSRPVGGFAVQHATRSRFYLRDRRRLGSASLVMSAGVVAASGRWFVGLLLFAGAGAAVTIEPRARSRATRSKELRERETSASTFLDVLRAGTSAGWTIRHVLELVQRDVVVDELCALDWILVDVQRHLANGSRLLDSLGPLRSAGGIYEQLCDAIVASEQNGIAIGPSLELLSFEARAHARRRVETAARRLPVTMLFPLVVCILPAFVLLTVVPLFVSGFSTIRF